MSEIHNVRDSMLIGAPVILGGSRMSRATISQNETLSRGLDSFLFALRGEIVINPNTTIIHHRCYWFCHLEPCAC